MSKKKSQHIVPRVYLKYWRISEKESFIYGIDLKHKFKKGVQKFGLNDKIFKSDLYYNDNSFENPYILEEILGNEIEPSYDKIMNEITQESNISFGVREMIIIWLYVSNMRNSFYRDDFERLINFSAKVREQWGKKILDHEKELEINKYSKLLAKKIQLSTFIEKEQLQRLLKIFVEELNTKSWRILKAPPNFPFWTNDKPGFSLNTHERFVKERPYHASLELNSRSIIIFPLSPKYCIEITPFKAGTPLDICALNMKIEFWEASPLYVEYINKGTLYTSQNVILSNNKEILDYCIKRT